MPKETNIKFNKFLKAVKKILDEKGISFNYENKSGSSRRFEIFENQLDVPSKMWTVHEAKNIYSQDLKKTCQNIGVSKDEFNKYL